MLAVGAAILLMTPGLGPVGVAGDPALMLPTLDWFDEGHTFDYELTNGTAAYAFNATITDETAETITVAFWNEVDGADRIFFTRSFNKSREDLNHTGNAWTLLWVNETDVNTEAATIGTQSYSLDLLASGDGLLVFNSGESNLTWTFDASKGWLDQVEDSNSETYWHLIGTRTLSNDEVEGLRNMADVDDRYCNPPGKIVEDVVEDHEHSEDLYYNHPGHEVIVQICIIETTASQCRAEAVAAAQFHWYKWFLDWTAFDLELDSDVLGREDPPSGGTTGGEIPELEQFKNTTLVWDWTLTFEPAWYQDGEGIGADSDAWAANFEDDANHIGPQHPSGLPISVFESWTC